MLYYMTRIFQHPGNELEKFIGTGTFRTIINFLIDDNYIFEKYG